MPALTRACRAMLGNYAGKGLVYFAVEVKNSLVDEDVEARSLEHSLDL